MASSSPYVCDTIPPPRLATPDDHFSSYASGPSSSPLTTTFDLPDIGSPVSSDDKMNVSPDVGDAHDRAPVNDSVPPKPARKLCARHQRIADEGTLLRLQRNLDALPVEDREAINNVWSTFSSSSHRRRALILQGLLTMCCFSQLSFLTEELGQLIRIDPFTVLPREVSLKVLGYLDATSLCRAAQVSRHWKCLADDDILWRGICEQHIGQKCHKCGWGLPILERKRMLRLSPSPTPASTLANKRELEEPYLTTERQPKRQRSLTPQPHMMDIDLGPQLGRTASSSSSSMGVLTPPLSTPPPRSLTRPWKHVYCERLTVERNWRRGRCTVRPLKGHTDGVMCLQFSETLAHPSFPILITGSYDRTVRVWNMETATEIRCLRGHSRVIRALQFDEAKLITGSMDRTLKVWDWRSGVCIRTLEGHTEGVVCLHFDENVLASGSVDSTVKIWNFRTKECFTLRGHKDWVNAVQIWNSGATGADVLKPRSAMDAMYTADPSITGASASKPNIDPGKMLFSASDDGTIRLWDLTLRTCVRQFTGHVGQVQSMKLLVMDQGCEEDDTENAIAASAASQQDPSAGPSSMGALADGSVSPSRSTTDAEAPTSRKRNRPVLISGSLDNTIKVWDIETGEATQTLFGHIEGVWAVASDKLRMVSGSHDRTIKVWAREEGKSTATLVGHRGAVTCVALGEDKIVSGSDDGDVRIWSFSG